MLLSTPSLTIRPVTPFHENQQNAINSNHSPRKCTHILVPVSPNTQSSPTTDSSQSSGSLRHHQLNSLQNMYQSSRNVATGAALRRMAMETKQRKAKSPYSLRTASPTKTPRVMVDSAHSTVMLDSSAMFDSKIESMPSFDSNINPDPWTPVSPDSPVKVMVPNAPFLQTSQILQVESVVPA